MAGPPDDLDCPEAPSCRVALAAGSCPNSGAGDGGLGSELVLTGKAHRLAVGNNAGAAAARVVKVQVATGVQHGQRVRAVAECAGDLSVVRRGAGAVDRGAAAKSADRYLPMNLRESHGRGLLRRDVLDAIERHRSGDRRRDGNPG